MTKRIVVACGTGMATSTMMAEKVRELLDGNGIEYTISQCMLSELDSHKGNADLFVTAMRVDKDYGIPVVVGTPFLVGIGEEEAGNKILELLK
ncbi:PTS sugar transporter subunit IIB [Erysipelothrix sp. HDW6A]|uniref:PTS sugar transporter subunit IIB n=1 Tax=Erysipelothrix sp. HDW6A TaxID=2714928 RepID=UPI00140B08B8|nr:PTS sugar transporter subunit IIB [Erysipelothrix sp. HDW6A]QIK58195.1 PTS sugar transporter subunit IIB [Erysipelothrix sp. HDW6A]